MNELCDRSATELAAMIRARDVSSREVVDAHLHVLQQGEPRIGAHGTLVIFIHPKNSDGVLIELMEEHGYLENLMRPMSEIGRAPEDADDWSKMLSQSWNHSDDEMYFLGYWGLYRYAFNDSLKTMYKEAILDHWEAERPEKEGAWNIFTALTGVDEFDLDDGRHQHRDPQPDKEGFPAHGLVAVLGPVPDEAPIMLGEEEDQIGATQDLEPLVLDEPRRYQDRCDAQRVSAHEPVQERFLALLHRQLADHGRAPACRGLELRQLGARVVRELVALGVGLVEIAIELAVANPAVNRVAADAQLARQRTLTRALLQVVPE